MATFKWGNGEIVIKPPTGRTRTTYWYYKNLLGLYDMPDGIQHDELELAASFLSRVDKVIGDIGFHVPNGDATAENLKAFCDNLLEADEALLISWNSAMITSRAGDNKPDLLPPHEVSDDKKKNLKSEKLDDSKESNSKNG